MIVQPARPERSAGWAYLIVVLVALLPGLVLALIAIFGSHSGLKHYCEGIEFGCFPSQAHAARLLLFFIAPPVAVVQIAVCCGLLALLRLSQAYRRLRIFVQGLVVGIPIPLLLAAGVLVLLI